MKITIVFIGKTKADYLKEGINEYLKRLKRYSQVSMELIPELKFSKKAGIDQVKKQEGDLILKRVHPDDFLILLDEGGELMDSLDFAVYLSKIESSRSKVKFVIGGAFGFSPEVYTRADAQLSLSKLTFSHQMVRLIFVEQLYRAFTILRGEPYHHK